MTVLPNTHFPLVGAMGGTMNMPPNPPSPADDEARKRNASRRLQQRLVYRLKKTFPGLPY